VVFVTVSAPELDGTPVDAPNTIEKLGAAEAYPLGKSTSRHFQQEAVEVRSFGGPFMRVGDGQVERHGSLPGLCLFDNLAPVGISKLQRHIGGPAELDFNTESGVLVVVVEDCENVHVFEMGLGEFVQPDIAEDAAEPPLILRMQRWECI
jgi:hypothetical protein